MVTVKVAGIGAAPGVGIAVVRVRTVLVDQAFFGKKLVQINGALPPAGERAIRPLEGVFVEPGVRLDDPELGAAVPSGLRLGWGSPIIQSDSGRCRDPSSHRRGNCWSVQC